VRRQELQILNPFHTTCATVAQHQVGKTAFQLANYISGEKKLDIAFVIVIVIK
jgi:hypothetical protein